MKRQLLVFSLFALGLVPDWVSACWPREVGPVYYAAPVYYAPPVYPQPPLYYCQPVYVRPCAPVVQPMLPPPRVEHSKPKPVTQIERPKDTTKSTSDPLVKPIGGSEGPKPAKPEPAPAPTGTDVKPPVVEAPKVDVPKSEPPKIIPDPKPPVIDVPKPPTLLDPPKDADPKIPPLVLPGEKDTKLPPLELPKDTDPKLPPLELPKEPASKPSVIDVPKVGADPKAAVPVPAPAPDSLIPPLGVPVPKADILPPLTLPPDTPVESKASPLAAVGRGAKVSVFPATGEVAATGLRKVGFYNHTDRDLALTIEGKSVKLPAKTYLHAHLPATFSWKQGDGASATQTVPADAAGVDVLFN